MLLQTFALYIAGVTDRPVCLFDKSGLVLASVEEFNAVIMPDAQHSDDIDPAPVQIRTSVAGVSIFGLRINSSSLRALEQGADTFTGAQAAAHFVTVRRCIFGLTLSGWH